MLTGTTTAAMAPAFDLSFSSTFSFLKEEGSVSGSVVVSESFKGSVAFETVSVEDPPFSSVLFDEPLSAPSELSVEFVSYEWLPSIFVLFSLVPLSVSVLLLFSVLPSTVGFEAFESSLNISVSRATSSSSEIVVSVPYSS